MRISEFVFNGKNYVLQTVAFFIALYGVGNNERSNFSAYVYPVNRHFFNRSESRALDGKRKPRSVNQQFFTFRSYGLIVSVGFVLISARTNDIVRRFIGIVYGVNVFFGVELRVINRFARNLFNRFIPTLERVVIFGIVSFGRIRFGGGGKSSVIYGFFFQNLFAVLESDFITS